MDITRVPALSTAGGGGVETVQIRRGRPYGLPVKSNPAPQPHPPENVFSPGAPGALPVLSAKSGGRGGGELSKWRRQHNAREPQQRLL